MCILCAHIVFGVVEFHTNRVFMIICQMSTRSFLVLTRVDTLREGINCRQFAQLRVIRCTDGSISSSKSSDIHMDRRQNPNSGGRRNRSSSSICIEQSAVGQRRCKNESKNKAGTKQRLQDHDFPVAVCRIASSVTITSSFFAFNHLRIHT